MTEKEQIESLAQRVDGLEAHISILAHVLGAAIAAAPDKAMLVACLQGFAERQDASGLYATSLSDDQLRRVQAGVQNYVQGLSKLLAE